jgi:glycosyltransferase involved in cell wall biosynthesis
VPPQLDVRRAFALDTAKHLSLRGMFPQWLALPDRWSSWWLGAVPAGLALIRKLKPAVLWSTYPIATAHLIALTMHRLTGIRWIADFRDPMAQADYPPTSIEHRTFEWIEYKTLKHCERAVFTAPGALRLYSERYPDIPKSRLTIIENGYDESSFASAERAPGPGNSGIRPLVLVHSGTVYPSERDPRHFFGALSDLHTNGGIKPDELKVVLRATGCDDYLRDLIGRYGLDGIVKLEPTVPYRVALAEMLGADALLVLQAGNCNYQVPAKLYEYLRARRPILALTDPAGDTAAVLRSAGIDTIAPLDSQQEISQLLLRFLELLRQQRAPVAAEATIAAASRRARTIELARMLDVITD